MAKLGSKKINFIHRKNVLRNSPKKVNSKGGRSQLIIKYESLLDSFQKEDIEQYELWLRKWGTPGRKRHILIEYLDKQNIKSGPCRELAEIRVSDLSLHQKLLALLRYRWYDQDIVEKKKVNNDSDLFWARLAKRILTNNKKRNVYISEKWKTFTGRENLISHLKFLYDKQKGKCAISGCDLELKLGINNPLPNLCSVDRINSSNGYTKQNMWLVAWWVNQMKFDTDLNTFKENIKQIYEYQKLDTNSK